jgi:hypothetical protein
MPTGDRHRSSQAGREGDEDPRLHLWVGHLGSYLRHAGFSLRSPSTVFSWPREPGHPKEDGPAQKLAVPFAHRISRQVYSHSWHVPPDALKDSSANSRLGIPEASVSELTGYGHHGHQCRAAPAAGLDAPLGVCSMRQLGLRVPAF